MNVRKRLWKKEQNPESVESALRQRERDVEGMLQKSLHLRKPWWCERNCEDKEKYLANSQQDLFARLKEETASVAEQRKTREEQEAAMNREREEKIKNDEELRLDTMGQNMQKRLASIEKKERDIKEGAQTLRDLSKEMKEGKQREKEII